MGREFRFPVSVAWDGGRRTTVSVAGKQALDVATPPEFKGTDPDLWSPEDAFVAAAASCLAVTIAAKAEHAGVPLLDLDVTAEGVVGRRTDGHFGFVRIEQTVEATTEPEHEDALREVIASAEAGCLVSVSLALPILTTVKVSVPATTG